MCRLLMSSCVLAFAVSAVALADTAAATKIREQIKALREEEEATINHIKGYYNSLVGNKKIDEREKARILRRLGEQERQALALAKGEKKKEEVRAHFHYLRRVLGGEVRLDEGAIRRLREHETRHIRYVKAHYQARIHELERAIEAANQVKPAGARRKK